MTSQKATQQFVIQADASFAFDFDSAVCFRLAVLIRDVVPRARFGMPFRSIVTQQSFQAWGVHPIRDDR